ncbi:unnamed protein product [Moneuplotes crassus]|uniref:Uncharacterized protein n=1 Tax=Euplotes crassus TaxID=5936 RepID=A0AAD2CXY8_EUPCR|nr:unnamed protein product [Moneuplotes crassus]
MKRQRVSLEKIIELEKKFCETTKKLDYKLCTNIYEILFGCILGVAPLDSNSNLYSDEEYFTTDLYIYLSEETDVLFAKAMKAFTFYNIEKITWESLQPNNKHASNFLSIAFPHKANKFCINSNMNKKTNVSFYLDKIIEISHCVQKKITFRGLNMSISQLKRLISSYRHVSCIELAFCQFSIPEIPNFSYALKDTQIQRIDLFYSGKNDSMPYNPDALCITNLLEGLISSPYLQLSLREIWIEGCGIKRSETQKLLKTYGLDRIRC